MLFDLPDLRLVVGFCLLLPLIGGALLAILLVIGGSGVRRY